MASFTANNQALEGIVNELYRQQMLSRDQYRFLKAILRIDKYAVRKYLIRAANMEVKTRLMFGEKVWFYDIPLPEDVFEYGVSPLMIRLARRARLAFQERELSYCEGEAMCKIDHYEFMR